VKIGDFLEIKKDERIPADMIVLKSSGESGTLFIRTDQLDGETDWKLRKAPVSTQKLKIEDLFNLIGYITLDAPSTFIYEFDGVLNIKNKKNNEYEHSEVQINDQFVKDSLSLENTLWANTILATESCVGIVIYTGLETRAQMNSSKPKAKFGILDTEINVYNRILFLIMIIIAFLILALRGFTSNFMLNIFSFIRFVVLLCAILPISVRVNLEIAKAINSFLINKNKLTPETIVRNSNIPEELGRIEFIFTDKTGTLTKNEMKFKQISFENFCLNKENFEEYKKFIHNEYSGKRNSDDLSTSLDNKNKIYRNSLNQTNNNSSTNNFDSKECSFIDTKSYVNNRSMSSNNIEINEVLRKRKINIRKANSKILRESIIALALCNNVTTVHQEVITDESKLVEQENVGRNLNETEKSNFSKNIEYQASSPDELALVNLSKELGVSLIFRDEKIIRILNPINEIEEFEILACFPFTSESKRMGILLRNLKTSIIIFYLKGSENVISNFISPEYENLIKEKTENLATEGLRTLVITQKIIEPGFYNKWALEYSEACISMSKRKEKISRMMSQLENNMEFLCVSGVEDKLQDYVPDTITSLSNAGIKFWMLTGDKVETATCIAISAGIKLKSNSLYYIKENPDEMYVETEINNFSQMKNTVLIIDGICLDIAINKFEKLFFKSTLKAPSVVCCRCSPTQKAKILTLVKKYTKKRTLAIGDGGNDVAMIQEAHCGVGIVGKEGKQASLAADFSITEFHHLKYLLLWFGRQSYKNTATVCLFVFHRGMIIAFMQYIFCLMFYYSPVPLYNGFLVMGYTSIYTNFPVFSLLLDRDTKLDNVLKFPPLYKQMLKGRELNFKTFLYWLLISLFQASIIMFGSIVVFNDQVYLKIISLTFTNLIFAELLNIYTQVRSHSFL
jgi:phospholipid-translocating ATPase